MSKAKQILLVDDDRDFVSATKELLEAYGYEVLVSYDGASGVEVAKKFKPDLMLLDVMMATDTEGFDVSRKVSAVPELQSLPVILMTGIRKAMKLPYGFEPDEAWLPVKAVLEKPVPPERLIEEVKKYVGKR